MSNQKESKQSKKKHNAILSKVGLPDSAELFLSSQTAPLVRPSNLSDQRSSAARKDPTLPSPSLEQYSIYGEEWCGFTQRAQALLRELQLPYVYSNLGDERAQFSERYADGHRTMPLVFYKGRFIGGFEQLKNTL